VSTKTERICEQRAAEIMELPNVRGVAGGHRRVLVFVERKVPAAELQAAELVPRELDGERTDVIEVGNVRAMLDPGTSIGLRDYGTGTLGAVVEDSRGRRLGLTNNHVAAASNRVPALTPIHSPGPADGLGRQIGVLGRYEPLTFGDPNKIDAALVHLVDHPARTHPRLTLTPRVGWRVSKRGRTTGHTTGTVVGRNATIDVGFGSLGVARFVGQIVTTHMLEPGDSGSVLTTIGGFACGLGFAGSDTISLANPMDAVLRTLAVRT